MNGGLEVIEFFLQILLHLLFPLFGLLHEPICYLMDLKRFIIELIINFVELQLQHCDILHLLHYFHLEILQLRRHLQQRALSRVILKIGFLFYLLQVCSDLMNAIVDMHLQRV